MLFFFLQGSINRWKWAKHLKPFAHMLTDFAIFGCLWLYHGEPFFQHYQKIARGNMVLLVEQNGQVSFQKLAGWQLSGVMFWWLALDVGLLLVHVLQHVELPAVVQLAVLHVVELQLAAGQQHIAVSWQLAGLHAIKQHARLHAVKQLAVMQPVLGLKLDVLKLVELQVADVHAVACCARACCLLACCAAAQWAAT